MKPSTETTACMNTVLIARSCLYKDLESRGDASFNLPATRRHTSGSGARSRTSPGPVDGRDSQAAYRFAAAARRWQPRGPASPTDITGNAGLELRAAGV